MYDIRIKPNSATVSTINDGNFNSSLHSHQSATPSSSNIPQPSQSAVTSNTTVPTISSEILSIQAHAATRPRKIKGIRQDPFNDYSIATFSDAILESVKVWDLRKLGPNPKPKLVISPYEYTINNPSSAVHTLSVATSTDSNATLNTANISINSTSPPVYDHKFHNHRGSSSSSGGSGSGMPVSLSSNNLAIGTASVTSSNRFSYMTSSSATANATTGVGVAGTNSAGPSINQNAYVIDIAWSTSRTNVLAVATSHQKFLSFYSTAKASDNFTRVPLYHIPVTDSIKCFSWMTSSNYHEFKRKYNLSSTLASSSASSTSTHTRSSLLSSVHGSATTATATATTSASTDPALLSSCEPSISLFTTAPVTSNHNTMTNSHHTRHHHHHHHRHELLIATQSKYMDIHVIESLGLSVAPNDSVLVCHGPNIRLNNATKLHNIHNHSHTIPTTTASPLSLSTNSGSSVSIEMRTKARCHAGYGMDTARNLQLLSDELDQSQQSPSQQSLTSMMNSAAEETNIVNAPSPSPPPPTRTPLSTSAITHNDDTSRVSDYKNSILDLISVWSWLYRVESLQSEYNAHNHHRTGALTKWNLTTATASTSSDSSASSTTTDVSSLLSFRTCGILQLIELQLQTDGVAKTKPPESQDSQTLIHHTLGVICYNSTYRRLARSICGWTNELYNKNNVNVNVSAGRKHSSRSTSALAAMTRRSSVGEGNASASASATVSVYNRSLANSNESYVSYISSNSSTNGVSIAEDNEEEDVVGIRNSSVRASVSSVPPRMSTGDDDADDAGDGYYLTPHDRDNGNNDDDTQDDEEYHELLLLINDCIVTGSFERAAALALFNGHIALSVTILQDSYHNITSLQQQSQALAMKTKSAATVTEDISTSGQTIESNDKRNRASFTTTNVATNINTNVSSPTLPIAMTTFMRQHKVRSNSGNSPGFSVTAAVAGSGMYKDDSNKQQYHHPYDTATPTTATTPVEPPLLLDETDEDDRLELQYQDISSEYLHCISMVAMCIAGYSASNITTSTTVASSSTSASVWISMANLVLSHLSLVSGKERCQSVCYLISMCQFLVENVTLSKKPNNVSGTSDIDPSTSTSTTTSGMTRKSLKSYTSIILNNALSLEDRVAFACSYLDDQTLVTWLKSLYTTSVEHGRLRGLIVTGLGREGLEIIQSYIDKYYDIQTAALIVGRIVDSTYQNAHGNSNVNVSSQWSLEVTWLNEYRGLLNRWRYFFARALLDVELGKLFRTQKSRFDSSGTGSGAKTQRPATAGLRAGSAGSSLGLKPTSGGSGGGEKTKAILGVQYSLPPHRNMESPHITLRCHYCSTSLPMDPMQQTQTSMSFLRKQKPIMNCCPHCKKQLPRCYVCLLYMGVMNPNIEFNRIMALRRLHADQALFLKQQSIQNNATNNITNTSGGADVNNTMTGTTTNSNTTGVNSSVTAMANAAVQEPDTMLEQNALEYGQWFFFCQKCRHGGHAACIESWFSTCGTSHHQKHGGGHCHSNPTHTHNPSENNQTTTVTVTKRNICGVSGCTCKCSDWT